PGARDGSVRLFDLDRKGEPAPGGDWFVHERNQGGGDVVFSPDNKWMISGGIHGEIKICLVEKRAVVRTLKGHTHRVGPLVGSPDGKPFASAGFDNVVKLWEPATGRELRRWDMGLPLQDRGGFVAQMAFTPDGRGLVTANANTTLYVLDLP